MNIYKTPILTDADYQVLSLIDGQRSQLRHYVQQVTRWSGLLRRNTMARAIQGSNSIEGYHATVDDAVAAVDNDEPMNASDETWREILGYRNAMTYILQLAEDDYFEFHPQLLRSLHFMMLQHSLQKMPGRWRPSEIFIINDTTEEVVYEGPEATLIPKLIDELIEYLNSPTDCHILVKAAMAHLNFTMIHPFKDGNGRMARALQTLVLSRDGLVSPIFSSIEEWLGRNTQAYYNILAEIGKGKWNPNNDAHGWIKFCLKAHFQQGQTIVKRNDRFSKIFTDLQKLQEKHKLHERTIVALMDAAIGLRVRAGRYRKEVDISDVLASRDLKKLSDLELLEPHGERRGRYYVASKEIKVMAMKHKLTTRAEDPYSIVEKMTQTNRNYPSNT